MELGLFNLLPQRDPAKPARTAAMEALEQIRLAEALGFDVAWFAEHHFLNYSLCPSPLLMAAWVAGQTERIRVGSAVVVVPLYQPARLLEEIAFVDQVSGGRLELGLGSGYQAYEFDRFGVDVADAREILHETLDILALFAAHDEFAYEGKHLRLPATRFALRPLQTPFPPLYIAGLGFDTALQTRMAREGVAPFLSSKWAPGTALAETRAKLEAIQRAAGNDPAHMRFALQRHVYVADDRADALAAAEHARYTYRLAFGLRKREPELDGSAVRSLPMDGEPSLEEIVANAPIGDGETVAARLAEETRVLAPTHLSCFMQFGGLAHDKVMRSMERFGAEVLPHLARAHGAGEGAPVAAE